MPENFFSFRKFNRYEKINEAEGTDIKTEIKDLTKRWFQQHKTKELLP